MRTYLMILVLCAAVHVHAEKPPANVPAPLPVDYPCNLGTVTYNWDFAIGAHDFYIQDCDTSGQQAWEYGPTSIIGGAPANVWGTVLDGAYPNETGSGLVSPMFTVTPTSYLVEVHHYFETESTYDGCNLVILPDEAVWHPNGGYTVSEISPSTSYYAWCVDGEAGWTGSSGGWRVDCFDLTDVMDYELALRFDFGSDASVTANGWYLARVVVGGAAPAEAVCCDPETGSCTITVETICREAGGDWHAEWSDCDPNPCPQPMVACCFDNGLCEMFYSAECVSAGGRPQVPGSECEPNPCPQPEACCFADHSCAFVPAEVCAEMEGTPQGPGTTCEPNPCGPQNEACCFFDGHCEFVTEPACLEMGGTPQGPESICDPNPCPQPPMACCFTDGHCEFVAEPACLEMGGTPQGPESTCEPNLCPQPPMACCLPDELCQFITEPACLEMGGTPQGPGTDCDPNPCGPLDPPSDLVAETLGSNRIRLTWDDNSMGEDGYLIERKSGSGGEWEEIEFVPGDVTTWEDIDLIDGEHYYYRVRAQDGAVYTDFSNFSMTITGALPAPPSNVVGTATSPITVDVTWTDNSTRESGFEVQRKEGEFGLWQDLNPRPRVDQVSMINTPAKANREYAYRVRAYNQYGNSAWAYSFSCFTPQDPGAFSTTVTVFLGFAPVEGAGVYVASGNGFFAVGETNQFGALTVNNLSVGDSIRAVYVADHWYNCRDYTDHPGRSDMGIHLWFDTDVVNDQAEYTSFVPTNPSANIDLQLVHSYYRYDLAFSTEWDIPQNDPYWTKLINGIKSASDYLYNVTDGQVAFGRAVVWDSKQWWGDVDVRIENSTNPHADVNQYNNCDDWSAEEHIHMSKAWDGWTWNDPDLSDWFRTLVHEFGHYALDLKDEYENGFGNKSRMTKNKEGPYKAYYPDNFGFMDHQYNTTEMSSANDYIPGWDYDFENGGWIWAAWYSTEQLWKRGRPCWEHVEKKLEAMSSLVDIRKPPWGQYVSDASSSTDRTGPNDEIGLNEWMTIDHGRRDGPDVEIEIYDSGPGSFESELRILSQAGPAADAPVYAVSKDRWLYLGRTDHKGVVAAAGLNEGDRIRAYHRDRGCVERGEWTPEMIDLLGPSMELVYPTQAGKSGLRTREEDLEAPGAAIRMAPTGEISAPGIRLNFRSDEPVGELPIVIGHIGARTDTLDVEDLLDERFLVEITIDQSDTLFYGRGIFEISLSDTADNVSTFVAPFTLDDVELGDDLEIYEGPTNFSVSTDDIFEDQLLLTMQCNSVPYRVPGFEPTPVTDLFSLHFSTDDQFPSGAYLNVGYNDSLLTGIDETSLALYRWDNPSSDWIAVEESLVDTQTNTVSGLLERGDLFCVFATEMSNDATPPGGIGDFGAVTVPGLGMIEFLWTAPGDDGETGTVQEYLLAYAEVPFTEEDWASVSKMSLVGDPLPAGSSEQVTLRMPEAGRFYYLALRAKDDASLVSPLSNLTYAVSGIADGNFMPAPVEDFRAIDRPEDEGNATRLTWVRSYDDGGGMQSIVNYHIYRNEPPSVLPELLATIPAGSEAYEDGTVVTGLDYTYWVSATDGITESVSPENYAFSARNLEVPVGDFTSDGIVGINDLGLMADTYGIDDVDPEFDPLFDLAETGQIYVEDVEILADNFGVGGAPSTDPTGENTAIEIYRETVAGEGSTWHLNLTARNASNLAGYSMRITYPHETLGFVGALSDSAGLVENMLNRNGGFTPVFLAFASPGEPGVLWLANAIQRPSDFMAPDGDGFLAHLTFSGGGAEGIEVSDIVLMDHQKLLNYLPTATGIEDGSTILRPHLYMSAPNPFASQTLLRFQVPGRQLVRLKIHDVTGRLVRTLFDGHADPGVHSVHWDGRSDRDHRVASGVYFLRLDTDGYKKARKLVFIR